MVKHLTQQSRIEDRVYNNNNNNNNKNNNNNNNNNNKSNKKTLNFIKTSQ